jgi:hypothetical protein
MAASDPGQRLTRVDGPGELLSWAGVIVGPAAWALQLYGNWAMGEILACSPASAANAAYAGKILGVSVGAAAAIVNAVLLSATIAAGVLAFLRLRAVRAGGDPSPGHRATWLSIAGVMTSVLFSILIAMSYVVVVLVRGCM